MWTNPHTDSRERYRRALERLAEMARPLGHALVPFAGDQPRHFAALAPEAQAAVLGPLEAYLEAAEQVLAGGSPLSDDRVFLWSMCKRLGLTPASDTFQHLTDGDVIELYNPGARQVFRNFPFFKMCTYTLDDLFSRPIAELIRRDAPFAAELDGLAYGILSGAVHGTQRLAFGRHHLEEIDSERRRRSEVEHIIFSPLTDGHHHVVAMMTTTRVYSSVDLVTPAPRPE